MNNNTKLGLPENTEAALAYIFGIFSGLFFLIIERNNQFVKFHSLQSIMFFIFITCLNIFVSVIFFFPFFGFFKIIVCGFIGIVSFISYIIMVIMAYCGKIVKIPYIGEFAWKISNKQ